MSVSRRASPPQDGHVASHPVLGRGQRRAALGRVVLDVGQLDRQLLLGHGDHAVALAVDDRDRAAPVALARHQPVAQPVVDRHVPLALEVQPPDDALHPLGRRQPAELAGVDHPLVAGVLHERGVCGNVAAGRLDDAADRQVEGAGEVVVALVVGGNGHHRARAVLHQHVVGDVHGDLLAVDRVGDGAAERDARLRLVGVAALLGRLVQRVVDVLVRPPARARCPRPGGTHRDARAPGRRTSRRTACPGAW